MTTQQEGEPWAHSEPLAIEIEDFTSRTDPIVFTLDAVHNAQAVVVTVELEGLTEIAWDGLVFLPRYAGSAWNGNEIALRRLGSWPPGRLAVRVEIVDTFDEALVETTKHTGALGVATLAATGTVAGGLRPLVDANHLHVWNCDDLTGSSVLVDSVGGRNFTLQGGEGVAYDLAQYVGGSSYPAVRSLLDAATSPIALASGLAFTSSALTIEMVLRMTALPTSGGRYPIYLESLSPSPFHVAYLAVYQSSGARHYGGINEVGGNLFTNYTSSGLADAVVNVTKHHMFVFDSTDPSGFGVKYYVDGVLAATAGGGSVSITNAIANLSKVSLCGIETLFGSPACYVRDIRISNIARDATYAAAATAALLV